jgi:hypothetical protein
MRRCPIFQAALSGDAGIAGTSSGRMTGKPDVIGLWKSSRQSTRNTPPGTRTNDLLDERIGLWVLKNSLCKNPQKIDRVRMPNKRFVEVA